MTTTPLVAIQQPKDISLHEIEAELNAMWNSQSSDIAITATRASTFSMIVYEPEEFQQLLAVLGFYKNAIDGIHGSETKEAVEKAQKTYELPITGRVDPDTLTRLREEVAGLPPDRFKVTNINLRGANLSDAIAVRNPRRIITPPYYHPQPDFGRRSRSDSGCFSLLSDSKSHQRTSYL